VFYGRQLSTSSEGRLLTKYKQMVAASELEYNDDQFKAMRYLSRLSSYLENNPRPIIEAPVEAREEEGKEGEEKGSTSSSSSTTKALHSEKKQQQQQQQQQQKGEEEKVAPPPSPPVAKGVYLHGGVGVGKTMAMDMFFDHCALPPSAKRRVHLHNFLLDIHARIFKFKQRLLHDHGRDVHIDLDPKKDAISAVAREVAAETWLLAFDEFEVTDVADALILSKFFRVLWEQGTVVVSTSNRHPSELYVFLSLFSPSHGMAWHEMHDMSLTTIIISLLLPFRSDHQSSPTHSTALYHHPHLTGTSTA
jgi:predicted ATPase